MEVDFDNLDELFEEPSKIKPLILNKGWAVRLRLYRGKVKDWNHAAELLNLGDFNGISEQIHEAIEIFNKKDPKRNIILKRFNPDEDVIYIGYARIDDGQSISGIVRTIGYLSKILYNQFNWSILVKTKHRLFTTEIKELK